ncbi:MAG: hypothetical protein LAN36_00350 [Acidobacteriia bacterium]|nr:hypothetical protein [Terriglobia bacterium]
MRRTRKLLKGLVIAALASAAFTSVTAAQGFKRPVPTPADWAALAKLPDFTGVWEVPMGGPAPATASSGGTTPARSFFSPPRLSLTPEYAAKAKALAESAPEDTSSANCLPPGMPGIMGEPYPMEFLLTPGQVTIVIEAFSMVRHIYTDGRPIPSDPDPTFFGTSIGHWDGNVLVVESVGFSPRTTIDMRTPHSDKMRILERFKLVDPDTMSIETTVTDPEALTAPYTTNRTLKRHRSWTIAEYICEQNNRDFVDRSGKAGINLTLPGGPASKPQ